MATEEKKMAAILCALYQKKNKALRVTKRKSSSYCLAVTLVVELSGYLYFVAQKNFFSQNNG